MYIDSSTLEVKACVKKYRVSTVAIFFAFKQNCIISLLKILNAFQHFLLKQIAYISSSLFKEVLFAMYFLW